MREYSPKQDLPPPEHKQEGEKQNSTTRNRKIKNEKQGDQIKSKEFHIQKHRTQQ